MNRPVILKTTSELLAWRKKIQQLPTVASVGFVPTMGALHRGHAELLSQARAENEFVLLSIFVNPTQFNNPEDLKNYPITWDQDLKIAAECQVDAIFCPNKAELYPDEYNYKISENRLSLMLCGQSRPGHFDGVLTVVMKLFLLAQPDKSYFGEKDYQQLQLIKGMVDSFFIPTIIVAVATVREIDGLALSSRNLRLSPENKKRAGLISKLLKEKISVQEFKTQLQLAGFEVDYVEDHFGRRFVAALIENIRLIDNEKI